MSGPMGGQPGRQRMVGKGSRRLATRGFNIGKYVSVTYRDPDSHKRSQDLLHYEGKIRDKRVGGQDRESYVELKDCLRINENDQVVERVDTKRLMDAYIEECEVVEAREDREPIQEGPQIRPAQSSQEGGLHSMAPMGGMTAVPMMMSMMIAPGGMQAAPMSTMAAPGMQAMTMQMAPMQAMPMQAMPGMQAMATPAMGMRWQAVPMQMQPAMQATAMQPMAMPHMMAGMQPMQMMMMPAMGAMMPGIAPIAVAVPRGRSRSRGR